MSITTRVMLSELQKLKTKKRQDDFLHSLTEDEELCVEYRFPQLGKTIRVRPVYNAALYFGVSKSCIHKRMLDIYVKLVKFNGGPKSPESLWKRIFKFFN